MQGNEKLFNFPYHVSKLVIMKQLRVSLMLLARQVNFKSATKQSVCRRKSQLALWLEGLRQHPSLFVLSRRKQPQNCVKLV